MHLFYTPDINSSTEYFLNQEESKHCVKVLRLQSGNGVNLIDGRGNFYDAEIVTASPSRTHLKILNLKAEYGKRNHYLHIAIAPTKNIERVEWFLEKATEIGVDEITPILCERSERKDVKLDRLSKVITSAVKQSIKAYHPKLNPMSRYKDFITKDLPGQRFIAHCMNGDKTQIKSVLEHGSRYLVLIGPEGDFTEREVALASTHRFVPITLGDSRLRTETAALEACFEINFLNR